MSQKKTKKVVDKEKSPAKVAAHPVSKQQFEAIDPLTPISSVFRFNPKAMHDEIQALKKAVEELQLLVLKK